MKDTKTLKVKTQMFLKLLYSMLECFVTIALYKAVTTRFIIYDIYSANLKAYFLLLTK